jgi:hypothetical protein
MALVPGFGLGLRQEAVDGGSGFGAVTREERV